jgi:hypothetical protein
MIFMVSTRSPVGYWLLTMPLWLVVLVTTSRADFAEAYRIPLPKAAKARAAVTAALFVPAVACFVIATPQPLDFRVSIPIAAGQSIESLTVEVTNSSDEAVAPFFSVATRPAILRAVSDRPQTLSSSD